MRDAKPRAIYLKDYQPPAYLIDKTVLYFDLHEDHATVEATLHLRRNDGVAGDAPLVLHGQDLQLESVALDGRALDDDEFQAGDETLLVHRVPARFELSTRTRIRSQDNSSLEGLYKSRTMFCTQCEAEGFRKITYYLDRPDVMARFEVAIEADRARYPVLLSNGNAVAREELPGGRHRVRWDDPFPKPAYLFALVAGDLHSVDDSFTTCGGREVALRIFVEEKDLDKCDHAMRSLKKAMRWDEDVYGREYDLDIFNIVAVDDFNMGAMENKSLNIFNSSCVLCSPETTTDKGFQTVEAIVAHEYFHNWSGNRVTCRDWFQLSLKEGFTVFRDAEFSADMGSRTVKRVEDATVLRTLQFAEDAGPMAHPVRPDSFIEISNFYTVTVYEKGAEVVRMIHTLLGPEQFRKGSDLYFERHDGQAVTCEDFVRAMEDASGLDLGQFRRWYSQAGTPLLTVRDEYDPERERYTLVVSQSCPPTPGQPHKEPLLIPLAMGLLGEAGNLPLRLAGEAPDAETADNTHRVLMIDAAEQRFVFEGVGEKPVPSLLRGFSAPVRLEYGYAREDLCALMRRDDDGFVRWDAAQQLAVSVINEVQEQLQANQEPRVAAVYLEACDALLADTSADPAMVADMLRLPGETYLAELAAQRGGADVEAIHGARETVLRALASHCEANWLDAYRRSAVDAPYAPEAAQIAARGLRNTALEYLAAAREEHINLARAQYTAAGNMTDRLAALRVISQRAAAQVREETLAGFYRDWRDESLVVNQWLQVQAAMPGDDALERVRQLMAHEAFDLRNPNKVRALVGGFANGNPLQFHRGDGEGYRFLADVVEQLNSRNPQIASRLLTPLTRWRNYAGERANLMRAQLQRLAALPGLSPDVYEVVSKSLED
ncbi:aminopeptidase N [Parahaliea mediterranea]|uniref:Aminopeptidase N n=1 Tax=Parahaliea mediterranea TaxID=651086 RepID=A0A939DGV4_9GAMM|nr:aminopeptidase N [Parahaliea mediterranea]MBN7797989.1 aminopeptidase N [Parahaliea mediterranea]